MSFEATPIAAADAPAIPAEAPAAALDALSLDVFEASSLVALEASSLVAVEESSPVSIMLFTLPSSFVVGSSSLTFQSPSTMYL